MAGSLYGVTEVRHLGFASREVAQHAAIVAIELDGMVRRMCGTVIVGPAFEGAHPDHDIVACICDLVARNTQSVCLEYLGYHSSNGVTRFQEFRETALPEWHLEMSADEVQFKSDCLSCYRSQHDAILQHFSADKEAFRVKRRHDYTRAEMGESVFYERWDSGTNAMSVLRRCGELVDIWCARS